MDPGTLKRILTCSKCGNGHGYFSEFLKSSCHLTCNDGKLGDFLDAPKDVVCSICNASHATVGLYLRHIDSAELHKSDWFHCLDCTHGGFPTIRYGEIELSQIDTLKRYSLKFRDSRVQSPPTDFFHATFFR